MMRSEIVCFVCFLFIQCEISSFKLNSIALRNFMKSASEERLIQSHTLKIGNLLAFMKIQIRECGEFSFCSVPKTVTFSGPTRHSACSSCMCSEDCIISGSCCPDYWLTKDIMNGSTFTSVKQLEIHLISRGLTSKFVPINIDTYTLERYEECVSENVLFATASFEPIYRPLSYIMVTSCPDESNFRLTSKCTNLVKDKSDLKYFSADLWIPVYSTMSGGVYRNIYCLLCHESYGHLYIEFKPYLICEDNEVKSIIRGGFSMLMKDLYNKIVHELCDIYFKRPDNLVIKPKLCQKTNTQSCGSNESLLLDIYSNIYLPVVVPNASLSASGLAVYRNIALYLCSSSIAFKNIYNDFHDRTKYKYIMKLQTRWNSNYAKYDTTATQLMRYFDSSSSGNCGSSFAYVASLGACRKISCPKLMRFVNSTCIPVVHKVAGVFYSTRILVRVSFGDKRLKKFEQYHTVLFIKSYIREFFKQLFAGVNSRAVFWILERLDTGVSILQYIEYEPKNESSYMDNLQIIRTYMKKLRTSPLHVGNQSISLAVSFAERFKIERYNNKVFVKDTQKDMKEIQHKHFISGFCSGAEFSIGMENYCVRITLNETNDVNWLQKDTFEVKAFNRYYYSYEYFQEDDGAVTVCADVDYLFSSKAEFIGFVCKYYGFYEIKCAIDTPKAGETNGLMVFPILFICSISFVVIARLTSHQLRISYGI